MAANLKYILFYRLNLLKNENSSQNLFPWESTANGSTGNHYSAWMVNDGEKNMKL